MIAHFGFDPRTARDIPKKRKSSKLFYNRIALLESKLSLITEIEGEFNPTKAQLIRERDHKTLDELDRELGLNYSGGSIVRKYEKGNFPHSKFVRNYLEYLKKHGYNPFNFQNKNSK